MEEGSCSRVLDVINSSFGPAARGVSYRSYRVVKLSEGSRVPQPFRLAIPAMSAALRAAAVGSSPV